MTEFLEMGMEIIVIFVVPPILGFLCNAIFKLIGTLDRLAMENIEDRKNEQRYHELLMERLEAYHTAQVELLKEIRSLSHELHRHQHPPR